MRQGVARGPEDLYCPFWRQRMSKVCHTCPFWQMLRGVHPQTGEPIPDEWNCSLAHQTKLFLEVSQQARQAGASSDKVATEVNKFHRSMVEMNHLTIGAERNSKLIEG